jgi:ATP-binding cassette, subfamily B, bacterial
MTATSAGVDAEQLDTPYWRLQDTDGTPLRMPALLRRLSQALGPALRLLRSAAPGPALRVLVLQLLGAGIATWALLQTAVVLEQLLSRSADGLSDALPAIGLLALAYGLRLALEAASAYAKARLRPAVHRLAEERLMQASLAVELAAFDDADFYDRLHRARDRGVMHLEGAAECLVEALGALLAVAAAALSLALLQPLLLPVLLLALAPEGWSALQGARLQYASMGTTVALTRQTEMMANLATQRESAPELRAHQAEDYVLAEYRRSAQALQEHLTRLGLAEARARSLGQLLCGLGLAGTFGALGLMFQSGWLTLAVAGTAVIALRSASQSLQQLMVVMHELFEKALYIGDYDDFLRQAAGRSPGQQGQAAPLQPGRIELAGVGFRYPGSGARVALQDLSLSIEPGQTIALVGENGSGKTTLAKLIAGLYRPTSGRICWSGQDIAEFAPGTLADRVVMVMQEPIRWPKSARHNVRAGRHQRVDADDRALQAAARQSRADELVQQLPQRWDTVLSRYFRGGQDLSGGQWQRLAVARGLYRDAPLVIWDEPTAALDARAEAAVYDSLRALAGQRTVVLITHRLASVRRADCIYFLERGRLVEQGRHEALMALGGRYAELYRLQTRLHGLDEEPEQPLPAAR